MSFRDARLEEIAKWAAGPQMRGFVGVLGQAFDDEQADLGVAIVQRFPKRCDPVALDAVGGQYAIERFDDESLSAFRPRVLAAWETWADAGTRPAIINSLHAYGVLNVEIYESKGDH